MPVFIHAGGGWVELTEAKTKVDGEIVDFTEIFVKVDGQWVSVWNAVNNVWLKENIYLVYDTRTTATDINEALEKMSDGGCILFTEGEWIFDDIIRITHSNICIEGVPNKTIIKYVGDASYSYGTIDVRGTRNNHITNISIEGLTLIGNNVSGGTKGIQFEYVGTLNTVGGRIINNVIEHMGSTGIYIASSINTKVLNNISQNNNSSGITLTGGETTGFNVVSHNILQNNNSEGITNYWHHGNILSYNIIRNNDSSGINIYLASNTSVKGNIVENNDYGIVNNRVETVTQSGNLVSNNRYEGLIGYEGNNVYTGNKSQHNGGSGLELWSARRSIVVGNSTQNNALHGIYLDSAVSYNAINGNNIMNNSSNNLVTSGTNNVINHNRT